MKLIYCFVASATLHAGALTMTSFPAGNFKQTIIPVRLVVSDKEEPGGRSIETKPSKSPARGPTRRAAVSSAQTLSETPKNDGRTPLDLPSPPLAHATSEPNSDISPVEIQTVETTGPRSFTPIGAGGASRLSADEGESEYDGEGGSGSGQGSGGTTLARSYAKADYAHSPVPKYPEPARRQGWEGTVLLDVLITREGKPEKIEIKQSSGFEILDKAATEAVAGWRFHPARYGTTALEGWVKVPIVFRLSDKGN